MNTQDTPTDEPWLMAPHVREVLAEHTGGLSDVTKKAYRNALSEFIQFCCTRWKCSPAELDFGACTRIQIGSGESCRIQYTQINKQVINDFLQHLTVTTKQAFARRALSVYFRYLTELSVIRFSPVPPAPARLPSTPKPGLNYEELKQLSQEIVKAPEPYRCAFIIQLSAGLRISELNSLRTQDVEMVDGEWEIAICRESLKGGRAWKLPLPDTTEAIDTYLNWRREQGIQSEFLFMRDRDHRLSRHNCIKELNRIAQAAGIRARIGTHDLRRGYSTIMDRHITNPDVLPQAMRHSQDFMGNQKVTRDYVHRTPTDVEEWTHRLPVVQLADSLAAQYLSRSTSQDLHF